MTTKTSNIVPAESRASTSRWIRAFTLIELLVVIAIIAILAAILLPVLQEAKQRAWEAGCINNKKQIQMAYYMYVQDNNNVLPLNLVGGSTSAAGWEEDFLDWTSSSWNTNLAELTGCALGDYASHTIGCYACPADTYLAPAQSQLGWNHRVRSIRMNGYLAHYPTETGWGPLFTNFWKMSNIQSPSSMWVFIDAHPDTGNESAGGYEPAPPSHPYDGIFSLPPGGMGANLTASYPSAGGTPYSWNDMPASYHNKRNCGFSFADGHAEMRHWLDPATTCWPVTYAGNLSGVTVYNGGTQDILWTFLHACNSGVN